MYFHTFTRIKPSLKILFSLLSFQTCSVICLPAVAVWRTSLLLKWNMTVYCPCEQDAFMLQPLSSAPVPGFGPGCGGRVQFQSHLLAALSIRFYTAAVHALRELQVTPNYVCFHTAPVFVTLLRLEQVSHLSLCQHNKSSAPGVSRCLCEGPCSSRWTSRCSNWHRWWQTPLCLVSGILSNFMYLF